MLQYEHENQIDEWIEKSQENCVPDDRIQWNEDEAKEGAATKTDLLLFNVFTVVQFTLYKHLHINTCVRTSHVLPERFGSRAGVLCRF